MHGAGRPGQLTTVCTCVPLRCSTFYPRELATYECVSSYQVYITVFAVFMVPISMLDLTQQVRRCMVGWCALGRTVQAQTHPMGALGVPLFVVPAQKAYQTFLFVYRFAAIFTMIIWVVAYLNIEPYMSDNGAAVRGCSATAPIRGTRG